MKYGSDLVVVKIVREREEPFLKMETRETLQRPEVTG